MPPRNTDQRILILAPFGQDGPGMATVLKQQGFQAEVCTDAIEMCRQMAVGAGVLLLTEEALEQPRISDLLDRFRTQPAWSELPLVILTRGGESRLTQLLDLAAHAAGGITLLERPMSAATLSRSLEVALRSRRRQYQVRDLLADQEQRRRELEKNDRLLRLVTTGARVGLVLINRHYQYLFANDSYCEVLGLPPHNIVGRHVPDLLPAAWLQIQPRLDRALAGESVAYELMLPPHPGTDQTRYFAMSYQPYRDASGEPAIVVAVIDITARKQTEKAFRRAKEFDETVMNNMAEGLYTVDNEGRVLSMNPAAERLFGWTLEELRGRKMHDMTHYKRRDGSPFLAKDCAGLQVLRDGRTLTEREDTFIRKDGTFFDVVYSSSPLREGEKITGLVVVFRDITDRKRGEEAKASLAAIVESSEDAIVSKDLKGIITSWNQGAERLYGYSAQEAVGRSITMVIPSDRLDEEPAILSRICRGERLEHYETIRRRKDGTLRDISLTVSPIIDAAGRIVGVSKIARDITARKRAERALHKSQSQLETALKNAQAAVRAKDQFLAAVSHELRTPLTPVLMNVSMLQEEDALPLPVRDTLGMIERNVRLEAQMVNDLLDFSRIANDKLDLDKERCDLHEIIQRAVEVCLAGGNPKGLNILLQLDARHHYLNADVIRLQQVFWNLIQNAIKFTPPGGRITLSSHNEGETVCITVADTGRGIDAPSLEKIFEPFEQGVNRGKESLQGLGLGLAIARRIVTAHGGTITAASPGPDRGATFRIVLQTIREMRSDDESPSTNEGTEEGPSMDQGSSIHKAQLAP
jgi:PAS domain S-box-containing protein